MEEKQTARILLSLFSCVDIHAVSNRILLTKKVHLLILSKIGGCTALPDFILCLYHGREHARLRQDTLHATLFVNDDERIGRLCG